MALGKKVVTVDVDELPAPRAGRDYVHRSVLARRRKDPPPGMQWCTVDGNIVLLASDSVEARRQARAGSVYPTGR